MNYEDEVPAIERHTTGQIRLPGKHKRKSYKDHDNTNGGEEHYEATKPYQKDYITTREDRKSHRPNRNIATGSPLPWQDPGQHPASSSRTNTRRPSGLGQDEYLGRDPGAFQSNGRSREECHHQSSESHDYGPPPRQQSPARSHRSSGSRASHSSHRDGSTPVGIGMGVDDYSNRSPYYRSTAETQYYPDPPTSSRGFQDTTRK